MNSDSRPIENLPAVEFFSGIGAFSEACRGSTIEVVQAFDQGEAANSTYELNFKLSPSSRNLDSTGDRDIAQARLWWASPPCTPFSRRGKRRDDEDPRAASFLNLIARIESLEPHTVMIENVAGFAGSRVHESLINALTQHGYFTYEIGLCPTQFGIPMKRPRHFVVAGKEKLSLPAPPTPTDKLALEEFLESDDEQLIVDDNIAARYGQSLNVVDPCDPDATLICFTSNYWKCQKASGSLLRQKDGRLRRASPREMLNLFGFSRQFKFPQHCDLRTQWRLVGNSVDVRSIRYLLGGAGLNAPKRETAGTVGANY